MMFVGAFIQVRRAGIARIAHSLALSAGLGAGRPPVDGAAKNPGVEAFPQRKSASARQCRVGVMVGPDDGSHARRAPSSDPR